MIFHKNTSSKLPSSKPWWFMIGFLALGISQQSLAGLGDETNLGVQLAASPKLPSAWDVGKLYPVRFNASNAGPATATNTAIIITLPTGISASSLPASCMAQTSETIQCVDASFAKNEKFAVAFKLQASEAAIGNGSISATISSDETDNQPENNSISKAITIGSIVELSISKSGDENATITGTGGLDCGATCQVSIKSNKANNQITLRAIPGFRNKLVKWTGVSCAAKPPFKCTINTKPGNKYQIAAAFGPAPTEKVILLLHGINTDERTWKDFTKKNFKSCATIENGTILSGIDKSAASTCYAVRFGAYDGKGDNGLEDAKQWATDHNITKAGDFSSFEQLGKEVDKAVGAIKAYQPGAHILLVAHSRGGLAARAFLTGQSAAEPLNTLWTDYVDGLVTTGSPHNGSPIGKIYNWLQDHPRNACNNKECEKDWQAVDQLKELLKKYNAGIDARRPVIDYLATGSSPLQALNSSILPTNIVTGEIRYGGVPLGLLFKTSPTPLTTVSYDVFPSNRSGVDPSWLNKSLNFLNQLANPISSTATNFIIGQGINGDYQNLLGDGLVPFSSQSYGATVKQVYEKNKVLHIEETKRVTDINAMVCRLKSPLLPSITFKNWVKC